MTEEQIRNDYDAFMKLTKALEVLYYDETDQSYGCLLKNHPNAGGQFYGMSHGCVLIRLNKSGVDQYYVFFSIASIDDGDIVFMGPSEDIQSAERRMDYVVEKVEGWDGWIPTFEECLELERNCGVWWNR